MNLIRLVIFDVTGTLLKPCPPVSSQYAEAAIKYLGLPAYKLNFAEKAIKTSFTSTFQAQRLKYPCYGALHNVSSKAWWFHVFSKCIEDCFSNVHEPLHTLGFSNENMHTAFEDVYMNFKWGLVYQDAHEVLTSIKNIPAGDSSFVTLAAVSNSDQRTSEVLSQSNIRDFFDVVVTSEDAKYEKPDIRIFEYALDKLSLGDIDRSQVLHVGDTYEKDYVAARNAGFRAVLLSSEQQLSAAHQGHDLKNLSQLSAFIKASNS